MKLSLSLHLSLAFEAPSESRLPFQSNRAHRTARLRPLEARAAAALDRYFSSRGGEVAQAAAKTYRTELKSDAGSHPKFNIFR